MLKDIFIHFKNKKKNGIRKNSNQNLLSLLYCKRQIDIHDKIYNNFKKQIAVSLYTFFKFQENLL